MARKSKRMQSILKLAQHEEKSAIEALGESSRNVEANIKQLEELRRYRAEYREQLLQQGENGFSAAKMQQFQQFLHKLDEVIEQQKGQIVVSEKVKEQRREMWLEKRTRTNALDKVTQRYQASEAQEEQRRDQKESDEMAQQRR
ncbi:MAG TPA: flagellar export protein FliJ [Ectothiorhodospiraceae bacterium]|nr:flagellar export protein FliJ [Ectothiorhodospiraceae bacterium]